VGPRTGLDNSSCAYPDSETPRSSSAWPVCIPTVPSPLGFHMCIFVMSLLRLNSLFWNVCCSSLSYKFEVNSAAFTAVWWVTGASNLAHAAFIVRLSTSSALKKEAAHSSKNGKYLSGCKIWGFHGGDYEEWCLLGCYAVWLL
jgi:hypothetical protein